MLAVPEQLGYPALAALIFGECAGLPIPGETALIVAGGLAATGRLSLAAVIAVAAVAAMLGDNLGYWLGRRGGRPLLTRDGFGATRRREAVARADRFFARYGAGAVFAGRWFAGVRYLAALTAGAAGMHYRAFLAANALGAIAWSASVATVAWAAGPSGSLVLVVASASLALGALLVARFRRRRHGRSTSS
jgi:membrane protein DedA with SNARE-associated domain